MESDAGELLRYRRSIGAESVRVFADVKKKHAAHALTQDVPIEETARAAEFFLADGVVVSGISTGAKTDPAQVRSVAAAVGVAVLVGSGVSAENVGDYTAADAIIVGSWPKRDGLWSSPVDPARAAALVRTFESRSPGAG
jgi:predicted TIM-barrel enzyme